MKSFFRVCLLASVVLSAVGVHGADDDVITIREGETLTIGGAGADPNNKHGTYIVFEPGSTLVVTQLNGALSVWPSLIVTNRAATVKCDDAGKSKVLTFQAHVFTGGSGVLKLANMKSAKFGHDLNCPVLQLDNVIRGDNYLTNFISLAGANVWSLPGGINVTPTDTGDIRLCGENMYSEDTVNFTSSVYNLCNPAAIPAGKTVQVAKNRKLTVSPLMIPDPDDGIVGVFGRYDSNVSVVNDLQYVCNVELAAASALVFSNSVALAFNGSVSGDASDCGDIVFSGYEGSSGTVALNGDNSGFTGSIRSTISGQELVLGHANAAVNAKVNMDNIASVRAAATISALSIGSLYGGVDETASVLYVAAGQKISVGYVAGRLGIRGEGTVDIGVLKPGAAIYAEDSVTLTYDGQATPAGAVTGDTTAGDAKIVVATGNLGFEADKYSYSQIPAFDIANGMPVLCGTNSVTLRAQDGVNATIVPASGEVFSVAGEGSFDIDSGLRRTVGWWFDFSRVNTRFRVGEGQTDKFLDKNTGGQPYIERVTDWRYPDAVNCLWNRRLYTRDVGFEFVDTVYAYLSADTHNNLNYLTMGNAGTSRRLPFSNGSGYNSKAFCTAHLVVMVFGAQNGGGYAMLGTEEGALGRTGTKFTDGITTNEQVDVWLDGVKVNPVNTPFKNGMQVISVDLKGLSFNGLGFSKDLTGERGGQNYGEILIFTNEVSDQVRLEAERYLARKWGLEEQYSLEALTRLSQLRAENPVRISGAGESATVINAGEFAVSLEGYFKGTVNLQGGTLKVPDLKLPLTEADIPDDGRLYWMDPDDRETVIALEDVFSDISPESSNQVRAIRDKEIRAFVQGAPALAGVSARRPPMVRQSRGVGPERTWLDFNADNDTQGNNLRFLVYPESAEDQRKFLSGDYQTPLAEMPVRTAFVVQDSVRGGGNPLLNQVFGNNVIASREQGSWKETMWLAGKPVAFAEGENRLDGVAVDYAQGFLGRPEVFTVRGTGQVDTPVIGSYNNSHGAASKGEIIGEVLLYSTALEDEAVKGIEAYLMGKWLGRLPDGFADVRQSTVAGAGTVLISKGTNMPRIDGGFEGEVAVEADCALRMTIDVDVGTVIGAINCPNAVLKLPAEGSITLDFTRRPLNSEADYTLIDCASGIDKVNWTLTVGENAPKKGVFVKTGNKVVFRHLQPGFVLSLR